MSFSSFKRAFPALSRNLFVVPCKRSCTTPLVRNKIPTASRNFFSSSKQARIYYRQPVQQRRNGIFDFLDRIPNNAIFYGIIGLNGIVFGMWYMSNQKYKIEKDPKSLVWMYQNFVSSWSNLREGRFWTPIAACFSHQEFSHILFNGFTFFFTAPVVLQLLGNKRFIVLYMGSGIASCLASLGYARYVHKQDRPSQGASGAIMSVVSFLAVTAPTMTFQLYGIIPIPAWLLVGGIFTYDVYNTLKDSGGKIDTAGHVGGMLSGAAYALLLSRSIRPF